MGKMENKGKKGKKGSADKTGKMRSNKSAGFTPIYSPYVDMLPAGFAGTDDVARSAGPDSPAKAGGPLFVLGGRRPGTNWLHDFATLNGLETWAIDSGAAACRAAGLRPSVIVGDRDSATREDWQWATSVGAAEHLHDPAKDLTDFQLAVELCGRGGKGEAGELAELGEQNRLDEKNKKDKKTEKSCKGRMPILTGCFGGRTDHFLSILETFSSSCGAKGAERPRCLIDDSEGIFLLHAEDSEEAMELRFRRLPVAVSLLSLSRRCRGVSIAGVRWPLSDVVLERNFPWSISNEAQPDETVSVSCRKGLLAVYWCYYR